MKKVKMLVLLAVSILLLAACAREQTPTTQPPETESVTAQFGGKNAWDYTWVEFEIMTPDDQKAFQECFGSFEVFEQWRMRVQTNYIEIPWKNGGKQPEEYTLAEFEALDNTLQILFRNSFQSEADYEAWMLSAQYEQIGIPWLNGGKQPAEYTWEEFQALTAEQQYVFQSSFETLEAFDRWLQAAQPEQTAPTIDQSDKSIWDYTWEEFEAMTVEEQMAFQNTFESLEDFDRWLQEAQMEEIELPWENGGKRPEDYTWAEFEALSPDLQYIFQNSFATEDGFEQWLMANMPQ